MKPDLLDRALRANQPIGRFIYMTPRGKPLTQELVRDLVKEPQLTILCGRYEGVDERLLQAYQAEEICIGDYVLSGGEPAAMILLDACIRLLPDVLGNAGTHEQKKTSRTDYLNIRTIPAPLSGRGRTAWRAPCRIFLFQVTTPG